MLAISLMGAGGSPAGCSCNPADSIDLLTSGGEIAASQNYTLGRASMGTSFNEATTFGDIYRANATTGHHLSEAVTESDHYATFHVFTRRVLVDFESFLIDDGTTTDGTTTDDTTEATTTQLMGLDELDP